MDELTLFPLTEESILSGTDTTKFISTASTGGVYVSKANAVVEDTALRLLHIVRNPKVCQGKPIIQGTRISVTNIVELYYLLKWDMNKIRAEYPHLSEEQILAALEYYDFNTKEIDGLLQEEKESGAH